MEDTSFLSFTEESVLEKIDIDEHCHYWLKK